MRTVLVAAVFMATLALAHDEGAPLKIGKGIVSFDEHDGFELSAEARARFKIATAKLAGNGPWSISKRALVYTLDEVRVYVQKNGKIKSEDVRVVSKGKDTATIKAEHLSNGDEVVVSGAGYLRVAEMDASNGEDEGHGH
ncbi:MAG: hypothetical protein JST80_12010 [Bdellovibrionales bacterium]|nr:hypothetical protein [Bdellovibrionales bacterium]